MVIPCVPVDERSRPGWAHYYMTVSHKDWELANSRI